MKRIIAFMLALVMVLPLVGCGGNKATIVNNYGETVQRTIDELQHEYNESYVVYWDKYNGATITVTGTVSVIKEETMHDITFKDPYGSRIADKVAYTVYEIYLEEHWATKLVGRCHPEAKDIHRGDKIKITAKMNSLYSLYGGDYFWVCDDDLQHNASPTLGEHTDSVGVEILN